MQTQRNIQTKLGFYEDLLYRIYTDDEIVKLIDNINAGNELEINNSQLRHVLHEYIYTMPYIQSITILMSSGNMVFDDVLTGYNTKTSWLDTSDDRPEKLFRQIASKDTLKIMSSHVVSYFSSKKYYLFHIAHRIIDYRNIYKKNGVVILSIDEKMLSDICAEQQTEKNAHDKSCTVILGADGTVISYPDKSKIGTKLPLPKDPEEKRRLIGTMVSGNANHGGNNLSIYEVEDEKTGWNIFLVRDRKALYQEITNQQKLTIFVIVLSVCALLAIILLITRRLTQSIDTVVRAMNMAGEGKLSVRVEKDRRMPLEMEKIADNFNLMVRKINELIEDVHAASIKQKNAEIRALEAQVNPHFLYNTLDTINWMAIDKNEFEISNAINALARILRYSIDNSNGVVKIRREVEWLKQYIFLQQTRLKNSFESCLKIAPAVLDCHIHKLLLQPFVENAIIHGFENSEQKQILLIEISKPEDVISILIKDNGSGIEQELLEQINAGNYEFLNKKGQLGIFNAMERFRMYYGERVHIDIESTEGRGTAVHIEYTEIEG